MPGGKHGPGALALTIEGDPGFLLQPPQVQPTRTNQFGFPRAQGSTLNCNCGDHCKGRTQTCKKTNFVQDQALIQNLFTRKECVNCQK